MRTRWAFFAISSFILSAGGGMAAPQGFVALSLACPSIALSMDYAGTDNFTGEVVDGYLRPEAWFSRSGTLALCKVQTELLSQGLSLKIFDAYRPVKAVRHFQEWAKLPEGNPQIKARHYPDFTRAQLFERGYIAQRSSHSRGSAVDLTIVGTDGRELDMGTIFDFFHERSHTAYPGLTSHQKANRQLLKVHMERNGFKNFDQEWWHYSLVTEAFPGQYFDFDVE